MDGTRGRRLSRRPRACGSVRSYLGLFSPRSSPPGRSIPVASSAAPATASPDSWATSSAATADSAAASSAGRSNLAHGGHRPGRQIRQPAWSADSPTSSWAWSATSPTAPSAESDRFGVTPEVRPPEGLSWRRPRQRRPARQRRLRRPLHRQRRGRAGDLPASGPSGYPPASGAPAVRTVRSRAIAGSRRRGLAALGDEPGADEAGDQKQDQSEQDAGQGARRLVVGRVHAELVGASERGAIGCLSHVTPVRQRAFVRDGDQPGDFRLEGVSLVDDGTDSFRARLGGSGDLQPSRPATRSRAR